MKKIVILVVLGALLTLHANDYFYKYGEKINLIKLSTQRAIKGDEVHYYKTERGHKVGVKDEIILECKEGVECTTLLRKYGLLQISKLSKNIFLVTISSDKNIFKFSQKLYNDSAIKFAHPNFIQTRQRR